MGRRQGSRNALIRVTFDLIAELAGGIRGDTVKRYAQRGQFDPRDLDSVLTWVNSRRQRQGEPLIGLPDGDNPAVSDDDTAANDTPLTSSLTDDPWDRFLSGLPVYVPRLARYLSVYDIP
jgi:hypothetical protein